MAKEISFEAYQKISLKLNYDQVVFLLGQPDQEKINSSRIVCTWRSKDGKGHIHIEFSATTKAILERNTNMRA